MITNFINNTTVIDATWLNKVDRTISEAIGNGTNNPTSPTEVKQNLGLDNVDNTSDANKPISTATQTALNLKQNALPTQSGNNGKYLSTDGTSPLWATVDALPSQTGNAGKVLTTDGTDPSWIEAQANKTTYGMFENATNIVANYNITSGNNAMSAGPITIDSGVTVTVPSGSVWSIV